MAKPDVKTPPVEAVKEEELTPERIKEIMSEPPDEYDKFAADEEDIFSEAEDLTEETPKPKDKKDEKPVAVESKKEDSVKKEPAQEILHEVKKEEIKPQEDKGDFFDKIERELDKPDGKEDLKEFTGREKAYFWQMRRDRRARQKAEEERDTMRLERLKEKSAPKEEPKAEPEEDLFKDRDADDFLTVAEAKKIMEKAKAAAPKAEKKPEAPPVDPIRQSYLAMCDREAKKQFAEDYDDVMACTEEIINNNTAYQMKVAEAVVRGDNPAVVMYGLIKGDPDFIKVTDKLTQSGKIKPKPPVETAKEPTVEDRRKTEDAKKAEQRLEENTQKPKTSGHMGGFESAPGEITIDSLLKMSDKEFARLPKATRDKYLKAFGV